MAKLFLIRRNMETFTGPLTVQEMKDAHQRLQFGISDEISGHCGPWITFENTLELKKYYPEVARVLSEEITLGWGVSDHTGSRLLNASTMKQVDLKDTRGIGLAFTFLLIALVAFAAAIYLATGGARLSGRVINPPSELSPREPQGFLERDELPAFQQYMDERLEEIVELINTDKKQEALWLPYLRFYAFNQEGMIDGVPGKTLRGQIGGTAPSDCSLKQWRRRWRASLKQWNQLLADRKLIRAHWARMLAWDPYWIRHRDNRGWIGNQNYYTACLLMADRALDELASDPSLVQTAGDLNRMGYPQIKRRLTHLLDITREGQSIGLPSVDPSNALSIWTCMEQSRDLRSLAKCKEPVAESSDQDSFAAYTEERYMWNALRIAAQSPSTLSAEAVAQLDKLSLKANRADYYTRFDYRAENKLLKLLSKITPGDKAADRLVERVNAEFPDVNFHR